MNQGFKKVGHKARHGRKPGRQGHKPHHTNGATNDPIVSAIRRHYRHKLRSLREQDEAA